MSSQPSKEEGLRSDQLQEHTAIVNYYRGFMYNTQAIVARDGGLDKCIDGLRKLGRLNDIGVAHLKRQKKGRLTREDWTDCWKTYSNKR